MQGARFLPNRPPRLETNAGPLEDGDCLTSKEFLRRYEALAKPVKIELIEGIVRVDLAGDNPELASAPEGIRACLQGYSQATPGTEFADNSSIIVLDRENIVRPEGVLRITEACRGRTRRSDKGHIIGAPELIAEVILGHSINYLRDQLAALRRNGVQEYVVWRLHECRVEWFQIERGEYVLNLPGPNNILSSRVFPGLCLNASALAAKDTTALRNTLHSGLRQPEHSAFVKRLANPKTV